jgi:hypothetical protein
MPTTRPFVRTLSIGALAAALLAAASIAGLPSGPDAPVEQFRPTLYPNPLFPTEDPSQYGNLAAADFNHDGFEDVVIVNWYSSVSVLLGAGDGTFGPATVYGSQFIDTPGHVRTHDFNGDGNVDLAVTDTRGGHSVYVFLGNGDGTFNAPSHYGTGFGQFSFGIADLNGDGRADLAVPNAWDNDVEILLGRGDGTFETHSRIPVPYPDSIAIADLDADGRLDLLVTLDWSAIGILRGRGDGTFDALVTLDPGFACSALSVADVDGNGRTDIVARVAYPGSLTGPGFGVLRGNGDGTFGPAAMYGWQTGWTDGGIHALSLHDVDGDGHIDVVLPAWFGQIYSGVAIAFGTGDGTFGPQAQHGRTGGAEAVGFADFDEDGKTDIAAVDLMAGGVTLLLNHGGRSFGDRPPAYAAGVSPISALIADFDADGRPDVATLDRLSGDVSILLGTGNGGLLPERRFPAGGLPRVGGMAADDFDGDGRIDLAVGLRGSGTVSILRGIGDGTFEPPLSFPSGVGLYHLISADLNHDGDPDLATADDTSGTVSILLGGPGLGFAAPIPHVIAGASYLAAADFDADGNIDLAAIGRTSQSSVLWLLHGVGDGTFSPSAVRTFPSGGSGLAAGDLDGDDRSDLVLTEGMTVTAEWLRGRGDGTFEAPVVVAARSSGPSVHVADADGDGLPDIVTVGSTVTIVPGNGDGTFDEPHMFLGARSFFSALGDLDLDGGLDIVLPTQDHEVLVLLNRHPPDADNPPQEAGPFLANAGVGSLLHIDYTPACGATDHAVYWGTSPIQGALEWTGSACGLGVSGMADFDPGTPPVGQVIYFVVVGYTADEEGSYGLDFEGAQRPEAVGVGTCDLPLSTGGTCP